MKKGDLATKRGFTIIEVSLVLAIAGLIFLMVMIALPALQRNTRDTQRKEDISALVTAVKKYQTNNRGALPTGDGSNWNVALGNYLGDGFIDPDGEKYNLVVENCANSTDNQCSGIEDKLGAFPNGYKLYVITQAKCAENEVTGALGSSNPRKFAVLYRLEGGGIYCEDG